MGRKWSEKDEEFIRDNFTEMSDSELADKLDRSKNSIRNRRKKELGLTRPKCHSGKFNNGIYWSDEKVKFLKNNYHDMTKHEIAEKLDCSSGAVRDKASRLGLKKNHHMTDQIILFIRKIHHSNSDWTIQEIADYLDLTFHQVHNAIRRHGLTHQEQRKWTEDEVEFLKSNYQDFTDSELAERLDRCVGVIRDKRLSLGLNKTPFYSDKERDFIKNNWEDLSDYEMADKLDRSVISVRQKRRGMGLKRDTFVDTEKHWHWENTCEKIAKKLYDGVKIQKVFDNGLRPDIYVEPKNLVIDAKTSCYRGLNDLKKYYDCKKVEKVVVWSMRPVKDTKNAVKVLDINDLQSKVDFDLKNDLKSTVKPVKQKKVVEY